MVTSDVLNYVPKYQTYRSSIETLSPELGDELVTAFRFGEFRDIGRANKREYGI